MGLHICLYDHSQDTQTKGPKDVPEWDFIRHSGDREVLHLFHEHGMVSHSVDREDYRPVDFDALMVAVQAFEDEREYNKGRWTGLVKLLRGNPNFWLYDSW